jgi:hypothetical protein
VESDASSFYFRAPLSRKMHKLSLVDTIIEIPICRFHHKLRPLALTTTASIPIVGKTLWLVLALSATTYLHNLHFSDSIFTDFHRFKTVHLIQFHEVRISTFYEDAQYTIITFKIPCSCNTASGRPTTYPIHPSHLCNSLEVCNRFVL